MRILRFHLPLIIPKGDCAIQVQDDIRKWYDCKSIMILDDTKWHNAWNYTKYPRYILIIDGLKLAFRKVKLNKRNKCFCYEKN